MQRILISQRRCEGHGGIRIDAPNFVPACLVGGMSFSISAGKRSTTKRLTLSITRAAFPCTHDNVGLCVPPPPLKVFAGSFVIALATWKGNRWPFSFVG